MAINQHAFFESQFVPIEQAKISVMTHALNYGTGCFEGIRACWSEAEQQLYVFRMPEHYRRLHRSCRILLVDLPYSVEKLGELTLELLRREGFKSDSYVRPLAYKSQQGLGPRLKGAADGFTMFALPLGKYMEKDESATACTASWSRVSDSSVPARAKCTGAYVNSALSKSEAQMNGFDEAIMLTRDGNVSEGSTENIFIVRDGVLITPDVTSDILEGITRETLIHLAREELGIPVQERTLGRTELYICDEAFLCGTGVQVAVLTSIDHRPVADGRIGPVTKKLREMYFDVVRGQVPKYKHWCAPVYEK